jgi:signal transduction histidine kinase
MLANASHELRSPLARLRMGLELIAEEPDASARQKRVEEIRRDIVELDTLIEEVLLYARADARVPQRPLEPVALGALISEESARMGVGVAVSGDATVPGDLRLLRHLVRNLLENAALHGGGRNVRASITTDADAATLAVEDDGPGVPEADRERVFAPFYRSTPSSRSTPSPDRAANGGDGAATPGHGLGLALVRQVARHHGGDARCTASTSGGSRFEVRLPVGSPASG